ncbi:MAG: CRISPR-associated protein Cas4 [Sulfuricellaceae bacterium]
MTDLDPIALSALQHWSYCPRQCALIHVEQAFEQNVHTQRGNAVHERVDEPGFEEKTGVRVERALPVWSERLGLVGKCDVVEFSTDGVPYPVEYKHGKKRQKIHDDLQLAAQALCLEEMTGHPVPKGAIFHHGSRRRREVAIDAALRRKLEQTVAAVRAMLTSGILPPPANDARCRECSLNDLCQPEALAARGKIHALRGALFNPEEPCAKS